MSAAAAGSRVESIRGWLLRMPASRQKEFLEQAMREWFSGLLGLEPPQIGLRDNLLELGVDSLKAVEFKGMAEAALDLELSSSLLFDYPTIERLARFCLEEGGLGGLEDDGSRSAPGAGMRPAQTLEGEAPGIASEDAAARLLTLELEAMEQDHLWEEHGNE